MSAPPSTAPRRSRRRAMLLALVLLLASLGYQLATDTRHSGEVGRTEVPGAVGGPGSDRGEPDAGSGSSPDSPSGGGVSAETPHDDSRDEDDSASTSDPSGDDNGTDAGVNDPVRDDEPDGGGPPPSDDTAAGQEPPAGQDPDGDQDGTGDTPGDDGPGDGTDSDGDGSDDAGDGDTVDPDTTAPGSPDGDGGVPRDRPNTPAGPPSPRPTPTDQPTGRPTDPPTPPPSGLSPASLSMTAFGAEDPVLYPAIGYQPAAAIHRTATLHNPNDESVTVVLAFECRESACADATPAGQQWQDLRARLCMVDGCAEGFLEDVSRSWDLAPNESLQVTIDLWLHHRDWPQPQGVTTPFAVVATTYVV